MWGDPQRSTLLISTTGLKRQRAPGLVGYFSLGAHLDFRGSTVLHMVSHFIRPLHQSESDFPVGGSPRILAPSSLLCKGSTQKQAAVFLLTK